MAKLIISLLFLSFLFTDNVSSQNSFNMYKIGEYFPQNITGRFSAVWGYVAPDNREYAIFGGFDGTYFVDVTDSADIRLVGFVSTPNPGHNGNIWREMKTFSHYAYIVSEANNSGIQIVDLQYLPDSISYIGKHVIPGHLRTHTISQEGPYLYLNGANFEFGYGVMILDLSQNPINPSLRGGWNTRYSHDSRIVNDTIWSCNIGEATVTVIDATDKDNPFEITNWLNIPHIMAHNVALTPDRKFAFVTHESMFPPGRLSIWNVEDLTNITLEHTFFPYGFQNSIVHNVEIYDTLAIVAYYSAGVKVLNIKDPTTPVEIGWYDTHLPNNNSNYDGCWGVYMLPSGKIIASDRELGLFVLKLIPPQPSVPVAQFIASDSLTFIGQSISFLDYSLGIPNNWEWIFTGPDTIMSNLKNPIIQFNEIGIYTVKLRVSNSFGSDSLTKIDHIRVTGVPMNPFSMSGNLNQTVSVTSTDTTLYNFSWSQSSPSSTIRYNVKFRNLTGGQEFVFQSNNNGQDTILSLQGSDLFSIANQINPGGDSSRLAVRAWSYNGTDSIFSTNSIILNVRMTTIGISQISEQIPEVFELKQNYPNPFNPSTKINFAIPKNGFVNLKVFDITGKEIAMLVSENLQAGFYEYDFDASRFPSGIYFYRLSAGDYSETKRLVLLK